MIPAPLRPLPAALLLAALALAGCLGAGDPAGAGPQDPSAEAARSTMTLHLGADLAMRPAPPEGEPARMPLAWGWRQWLDAEAPPTWVGPAAEAGYVVLNASVTFSYSPAGVPALSAQARPELTAWWGPGASRVHHAFLEGPDVVLPGEVHEATMELRVPAGGLVIAPGEGIELSLGTYFVDDAAASVVEALLHDPGHPATLDLVVQPLDLPATRAEPLLDEQGTLAGAECLGLSGTAPTSSVGLPLELPAGAAGVALALERTGGEGPPDLDFTVRNATGEAIGRAQGPGPAERLTLRGPNLAAAGPGPWTVEVYSCTPQAATFRLVAEALLPA